MLRRTDQVSMRRRELAFKNVYSKEYTELAGDIANSLGLLYRLKNRRDFLLLALEDVSDGQGGDVRLLDLADIANSTEEAYRILQNTLQLDADGDGAIWHGARDLLVELSSGLDHWEKYNQLLAQR